ncbi:hypothetical protein EDC19_1650 [Natranaerovirga hydrolytica]|uniref:Uncharacterized protein n=1 Tax=Natranaerovirga hydrolytica TaxID=680378 RepID=A0A4R1MLG8_9FIRM|nr:hypothetical protein [Natranaerovirga hydrolytica]TCK93457.1 hypothetical protein EDC19_1650 [Natranaerovirga hydrolytica]
MSKKRKIYGAMSGVILALGGFLIISTASASTGEAGSVDDPLVTKSYVDNEISKRLQGGQSNTDQSSDVDINALYADLIAYVDGQIDNIELDIKVDSGEGLENTSFEVLELMPNQTLIGKEGTELIVRSGEALIIDNQDNNGIPNVTTGDNLKLGEQVALNHLLIIPREDGRGIVSKTGSWIMIRGDYTIQ